MSLAARITDKVLQTGPHCHAPVHPGFVPMPHPPMPLMIMPPCAPTVFIGGLPAARITDQTIICTLVPCVPGGPGMIAKGSATVMIANLPAARVGDDTLHPACVGPLPGPAGKIIGPGCPTVMIGG